MGFHGRLVEYIMEKIKDYHPLVFQYYSFLFSYFLNL